MKELLEHIKSQRWFYEFPLPDGTATESYLEPRFRGIHQTRDAALRSFISTSDRSGQSALDIACHEGYFTLTLSEFFSEVTAIDKNAGSLRKARDITRLIGTRPIEFVEGSMESLSVERTYDFVLCFGLLYHIENPMQVFRQLGRLAKRELCIETQVLPFDVCGSVEDGSFGTQRPLRGLFGICDDYSSSNEGGLTDTALVPSRSALDYCVRSLGFSQIEYYEPATSDYEQFVRGHRVVLVARRDAMSIIQRT
jgi:tRNA (mo5U34)-methyltransferase